MGEMRKLTTVAVDNSMTREMAVQYAVWTWYQSDPGEKARDLCRAGAEIVLPRFIENEESALEDAHRAWKRSLFASDKPDSSTEVADKPIGGFSLQSDYIENYAPLEMLAMSLESVPAPSKADYWDYKKVLREAILTDMVNSARWEDKNATKILSSEEHIDQFTVGELMSLPSCCVTAQNSTLLAKHVGKKLLEERDIDKLFPEAAKLWKSAHSDAENIRASVRRGKTLLELLLLALILLAGGFAANYFDAAQTAFVILVTGVVLLALCLGGGIAAFATAAVLLVLNTVYPYAQYAPNALYVLGALVALVGIATFLSIPTKEKAAKLAAKIEPTLLQLRREYGMYSAFVMRYLHKIDEADTKTVDAYEEVLQNLFKRMSELEIDLYRCPGNTIDNLKPKEDGEQEEEEEDAVSEVSPQTT